MKTEVDCLPCFVRQALQVARVAGCPAELQMRVVQRIAAIVATVDTRLSPPVHAGEIYREIAEITGCPDPYRELKKISNKEAIMILPGLRQEIAACDVPLPLILRFAIAGNSIDYGAFAGVNIQAALDKSRCTPFAVDHSGMLADRLAALEQGGSVLYLADNSGEIVYDKLLVEYLYNKGLDITLAVKDGPIINDALREDALEAGLDRFAGIISNGARCPGTVLEQCSAEFIQLFHSADLVISKGQGNFESLSTVRREIFFLLMLKCPAAAHHMAELACIDAAQLPGKGEMVVYCSTLKKDKGEKL